jgi:hypothetical protein
MAATGAPWIDVHAHPGRCFLVGLDDGGRLTDLLEPTILLFEWTLADLERVLGADHPNVVAARTDLEEARIKASGTRLP